MICTTPVPVWLPQAVGGIIEIMKQASLGLTLTAKQTRKQVFVDQMDQVFPWAALVELIAPYYPEGHTGRPASGARPPAR